MSEELRIVIADDEKMVRDGIVATLPWEKLCIQVAGIAPNGRVALQLVHEQRPHILLTDVCMPFMDGLELIKEVKKEFPTVKSIILSAYDEFDYARKAMQYGSLDYLIKPIQADELTALLQRVASSIHDEIMDGLTLMAIRKDIQNNISAYVNSLRLGNVDESFHVLQTFLNKSKTKPVPPEICRKLIQDIITTVIQELHIQGILSIIESEKLTREQLMALSQLIATGDMEIFFTNLINS
jgi:two-component system response regulator YesN